MKHLILMGSVVLNLSVFANSVEEADGWYGKRGEDVENVRKAVEIYKKLAAVEQDQETKVELVIKQLEALSYLGDKLTVKDEKLELFEKSVTLAKATTELVDESETPDEELLAQTLYWFGVHLSKFGRTKGVLKSLTKAPDVKKAMKRIIDMGYGDVNHYGAHRVLGRVFYKLPGMFGGDKSKAKAHLEKAFTETLVEGLGISSHGLNNIYYAEALRKKGEKAKACTILKTFVEQDPTTLLVTRIPETTEEIVLAQEILKDYRCL